MRTRHPLWVVGLLFLVSLSLAACGSDEDAKKDDAKADEKAAEHKAEKKIPSPTPICPQVAIVRGLDVIRNANNDSSDSSELIAGAKLLSVDGDCEYLDEGGIDVAFNLNLIAKRGPKLEGRHANFPLFVAVLDPQGNILNKNIFNADIKFSSDDEYINHSESLHVYIPLPKDKHTLGPYYRVLGGFQLSAAQETEKQSQQ